MKHLLPLLTLICACGGGGSTPPTGPLTVNLIALEGTSEDEMVETFKAVQTEYYNQLGIALEVGTISIVTDPAPGVNSLSDRNEKFDIFGVLTGPGITYIWAGPLYKPDGSSWKTGKSSGGCRDGYAVGFHKPNHPHNTGLMMHELGHLLGAGHTDDDSVMSGYLPAGTNRWFSGESVLEIGGCVNGN